MFNYQGRQLDEATLVRLSHKGPVIKVAGAAMTIAHEFEHNEIIVVPMGSAYHVLAGGQELAKHHPDKPIPVRLLSKQLLKSIADVSVNGTAVDGPLVPFVPRQEHFSERPRNDRPRQNFERRPPQESEYFERPPRRDDYAPAPSAPVRPHGVRPSGVQINGAMATALVRANVQAPALLTPPRREGLQQAETAGDIGSQIAKAFRSDRR